MLLRRALWLFLPISAAITLVLLPMVALYEQSRRETLKARLTAQAVAATTQVQATMEEIAADNQVSALLLERQLPPRHSGQLRDVLHSVVKGYRRYRVMAVYDRSGRRVDQASDGPPPQLDGALAAAVQRGLRLRPGALWVSPVFWSGTGEPFVAAVRALSDRTGRRFGVLLSLSSLEPLAQDVDRGPNASGSLERAFLLSADGRLINRPAGWRPGESFAARFPQLWARLQGRSSGLLQDRQGLFLHAREPLRGTPGRVGGDGPFLRDSDWQSQRLAVVIQVPPQSLSHGSAFAQPAGQAVVALLYLLVAGASAAIAAAQLRLEALQARERSTHQRLQTVLRTAGVGMCLCDPASGRFLSANDALCQFFARTEQELLACTWQQLTHPEDLAADQRLAEQLQRGDFDQYRLRKRFLRPDGSTIWGDLVVSCTRHADGGVCDLIAQVSDVSELVTKTAYLEAAASAGVVGVWDWDVASDRQRWDAVMFRLHGLTPQSGEAPFELWRKAIHPEDRSVVMEALQTALHGGAPFDCQFRVVWPDGSVHDIRARADIGFGRDGRAKKMVGVNYEVTDLVRKSAYLEAAASAGVVGVWDWDVRSDVLSWDPVMYRLYCLRAEDFQGTREAWERAVHPEDKAFVLGELQAALNGWREYKPRFRVIWPDGSIHHLQARSRTTFRPDGAPLRMIGVNYDVTEQVEREQEVDHQRLLLATTIDALVDPLLVLSLESASQNPRLLRIAELNPAAATFFSSSQPKLVGQPLSRLLPFSLNGSLHAALQAVLQGGPPLLADGQPVLLGEGAEPLHLDLRAVAVGDRLILNFRDVSDRRRAVARLAASEERFRLLAENASDVVFQASLTGETEWITASVTPLLGWAPADLEGRPFEPFVHPDDQALLAEVRAAFQRGERRQYRLRVRHKQGGYRWMSINARGLRGDDGRVVGLVGSWRDAQAEVESELELDRRARIDPLTGLFNRQETFERLERLASRRRQADGSVAVLFCDIDHFKAINDRLGHAGGDAVLQALAERLRQGLRQGDLVGRIGGDELLVVLQSMPTLEAAMAVASKIHAEACEPLRLPGGEVRPALSIGVTLLRSGDAIGAVVQRADQAMYAAKEQGRDRVISFD